VDDLRKSGVSTPSPGSLKPGEENTKFRQTWWKRRQLRLNLVKISPSSRNLQRGCRFQSIRANAIDRLILHSASID
jgi:hypothetical protein